MKKRCLKRNKVWLTLTFPAKPVRCPTTEGSTVGIIGGLGEMGRLFSKFFISHGFRVNVADLLTQLTPEQVVSESDIVIFAVPLHKSVEIIRKLVPYTRQGQLLMDLTSLKTAP